MTQRLFVARRAAVPACILALGVTITGCGLLLGLDQYSPSSCADGVRGGSESDVDCGGPMCAGCDAGRICSSSSDCVSGRCEVRVCAAPSCDDAIANGLETDIDCGGECEPCPDTGGCAEAKDCASGVCTGGTCQAPTCEDAAKNGGETDIDCGGGACKKCSNLGKCGAPQDCVSAACESGTCGPWSKQFGSMGADGTLDVAIDVKGDIVIVGNFSGSVSFGSVDLKSAGNGDIFVAKFSPEGAYRWAKRFGGPNHDIAIAVEVDAAGDIVLSAVGSELDFGGKQIGTQSGQFGDILVAKLSGASGGHIWSKAFPSGGALTPALGLRVDAAGNVLIGGSFVVDLSFGGETLSSAGSADAYITKLSAGSGSHIWSKSFGGPEVERVKDVAVDSAGNVVVLGTFASSEVSFGGSSFMNTDPSALTQDIFLLKLSGTTGAYVWSWVHGSDGSDQAGALATDSSGDIIVTGGVAGVVDLGGGPVGGMGGDGFAAKYRGATGAHLWSMSFGGLLADAAHEVGLDSAGNAVVTGSFTSSVADFGGGPLSNPSSPLAGMFVVKYAASDGGHLFSAAYGGSGEGTISGISIDPGTANLVLTGLFEGGIDWGAGPLASAGETDAFLVSLGSVP